MSIYICYIQPKPLPRTVTVQSELRNCSSIFSLQLSFTAELPPLALVVYHVTKAPAGSTPRAQYTFLHGGKLPNVHAEYFQVSRPQGAEANAPLSLSNKHVEIWSSAQTGLLQVRLSN